jgi:hypothetical protein
MELPEDRGRITVLDVLAAPPGAERDFAMTIGADPCGRHSEAIARRLSTFCGVTRSSDPSWTTGFRVAGPSILPRLRAMHEMRPWDTPGFSRRYGRQVFKPICPVRLGLTRE